VTENNFITHTSGAQKDKIDKLRLDLVPPEMILSLGTVLTYGAQKYDDRNWEKGIPYMDSYAASMRHLLQWASGVDIDDESGLQHIEQAALNLLMIATQTRRGRDDLDNRVKPENQL
jgi:hypothetical protein